MSSGASSKKAPRQRGVCVNHLKRCKTSNLGFLFDAFYKFAGGAGGTHETGTNKDTRQLPVISMGTLIDVPAHYVNFVISSG